MWEMGSIAEEDKKMLDANVNKTVQTAALKKISDLVNQAQEEDRNSAFLAKRFLIAGGVLAAIIVAVCVLNPNIGAAFLRLLTVLSR